MIELHRLLKPTGSIFFHCDKSASHHIRILLDKIFGISNFRSEIIWYYRRWSNSKKGLLNSHQNIYFYTKSDKFKFNTIYGEYSPTTNVDQILQERKRNGDGKTVYKTDANGKIIYSNVKDGVPLSDVWEIPFLNPKAKERVGYPTQKPILLLERIIEMVTDEKDLVLDPFLGSGTTVVACKLLNRNYFGIDMNIDAINLAQLRLDNPIKTSSQLIKKGKVAYMKKNGLEQSILTILDATPVQRNKGIDGFLKDTYKNTHIPVKIQKPHETLEDAIDKLIKAGNSKGCIKKILIRTNTISNSTFLETSMDADLHIIDSYDILIKNIIK